MSGEVFVMKAGGSASLFAVIAVTYPSGSICTCGGKAAKDTSGYALFNVKPGTYTVECHTSDNSQSKSTSVTIAESDKGKCKNVTLSYELVLFDYGDKTSVTGGWNTSALRFKQVTGQASGAKPTVTKNSDGSITLGGLSAGASGSYITANKIDLSGYSTVRFIGTVTSDDSAMPARSGFAVSSNLTEFLQVNASASMNFPSTTSKTYSGTENFLDISSVTGSKYLLFGVYNTTKITIKKLWLV